MTTEQAGASPRGASPREAQPSAVSPPGTPSARPEYRAIRKRLEQHIEASRKARRRRLALVAAGTLSAVTLVVSGTAWALTGYVSSSVARVDAGTAGTPPSGPINILLAGVDTRDGLTRKQELSLHVGSADGANSDTMMLVHIPADHRSIQVVSLPRDSWVDIPGHGMNKINAAYGLGGAQLMVSTVEQATNLVINDYVEVNFLAFIKVIDALGGVNICVPYAINDPDSGLRLSAGSHHVDGLTALEFARDRHSFATSDLARIGNQQQLLSSLFAEAATAGVLADPVKLQQVLSAVTAAVKVDNGFSLTKLADELRGIQPSDITFTTVPIATASYVTPTGQSAVLWDQSAATTLFTWLRQNTGTQTPSTTQSPAPAGRAAAANAAKASIDVYNGTAIAGLSATRGRQLAAAGFTVHGSGLNWSSHDVGQTLIQYPAGQAATARQLAAVLPGSAVQAVGSLSRVRVVLGATGSTFRQQPAPAPASPAPTPPGTNYTAAQYACR